MSEFYRVAPSENVAFADLGDDLPPTEFIERLRSPVGTLRPLITKISASRGRRDISTDVIWCVYGCLFSERARQILKAHHMEEYSRLRQINSVNGVPFWYFEPVEIDCILGKGVMVCELDSPLVEEEKLSGSRRYEKGRSLALVRWWNLDGSLIEGKDSFCVCVGGWTFFSKALISTLENNLKCPLIFYETRMPSGDHWREFSV